MPIQSQKSQGAAAASSFRKSNFEVSNFGAYLDSEEEKEEEVMADELNDERSLSMQFSSENSMAPR